MMFFFRPTYSLALQYQHSTKLCIPKHEKHFKNHCETSKTCDFNFRQTKISCVACTSCTLCEKPRTNSHVSLRARKLVTLISSGVSQGSSHKTYTCHRQKEKVLSNTIDHFSQQNLVHQVFHQPPKKREVPILLFIQYHKKHHTSPHSQAHKVKVFFNSHSTIVHSHSQPSHR